MGPTQAVGLGATHWPNPVPQPRHQTFKPSNLAWAATGGSNGQAPVNPAPLSSAPECPRSLNVAATPATAEPSRTLGTTCGRSALHRRSKPPRAAETPGKFQTAVRDLVGSTETSIGR